MATSATEPTAPAPTPHPPASGAQAGPASAVAWCPNCGAAAGDVFCPRCGQEQVELRRSLRAHADDLLDAMAGWDGKIPRTLWALVRRPGLLTAEFLAGRRVRYVRPLKLYLWLSVLFFLALRLDGRGTSGIKTTATRSAPAAPAATPAAGTPNGAAREAPANAAPSGAGRPAGGAAGDRATDPGDRSLGARVRRAFRARLAALAALPEPERDRVFKEAFLANTGRMLFALLPLFALLLRALYLRGGWYYTEHLVFALHVHALAMLALTIAHLAPGAWSAVPQLWIPAATFVAMRRVYGESRRRTAAKFAALSAAYLVVSGVVLMLTLFATLLLLPT
jgi:hypothetical protein